MTPNMTATLNIIGILLLVCLIAYFNTGCTQIKSDAPTLEDICKKKPGVKTCQFTYKVEWYFQ